MDRGDFGWRFSLHHALNEQPCDLSRPKSYSSFFRIFRYSFRLHSVDSARAGLITVGFGDHNVCKFGCVFIVCLCEPHCLSMYFQLMQSPESISLYRVHPLCATSLPDTPPQLTWGSAALLACYFLPMVALKPNLTSWSGALLLLRALASFSWSFSVSIRLSIAIRAEISSIRSSFMKASCFCFGNDFVKPSAIICVV